MGAMGSEQLVEWECGVNICQDRVMGSQSPVKMEAMSSEPHAEEECGVSICQDGSDGSKPLVEWECGVSIKPFSGMPYDSIAQYDVLSHICPMDFSTGQIGQERSSFL